MRNKASKTFPVLMILLFVFSFTAFADMGPKPSVVIQLEGLGDEPCYGTLLSKYTTNGPNAVWIEGEEMRAYHEDDPEIWRKFVDYKDTDGYYFLQQFWCCNGENGFTWGYYPPEPFKVLLYFPESDTFAVSPAYEQYAFDSYYKIDISTMSLAEETTAAENASEKVTFFVPGAQEQTATKEQELHTSSVTAVLLTAEQNYDYSNELVSFAVRVVLTIAVELALALIIGFRSKKILGFIAATNAITQLLLNIFLFGVDFKSGSMAFTFWYAVLELAVLTVETLVYSHFVKKHFPDIKPRKAVFYALAANAFSFAAGLGLAHLIPGIF